MSKETAPNFREVQACNNCKFNVDYYTEKGGCGTYVGCMKYEGTEDSCYNQYVCDGYMDMGGEWDVVLPQT